MNQQEAVKQIMQIIEEQQKEAVEGFKKSEELKAMVERVIAPERCFLYGLIEQLRAEITYLQGRLSEHSTES